jgi:hypothetical protein
MINHPLTTLFFDVTANGGWNLVAIITWSTLITLPILAFLERKK